ncbi:MAG: ABC transporter ATP-binding protein [Deltaproteobacteria bacterium]|nr:ABC transporter ATP-binding protein [Deltaproteobacteria bacterium]
MSARRLRVARICKDYGRQRALVDVSLEFAPGRVSAVVGPNGAGKTTLLGILSTLVRPTSGEVLLGDEPLGRAARHTIGYVGHEPGVYPDLSARHNLLLFASLYGLAAAEERVSTMLDRVSLGDVRETLPARSYSRGMLQRLALARALLHEPDIVLFDEPASALDPAGVRWLVGEIERERAAGRLVILVTHDLEAAASVASHLVVLRRGRVALDRTEPAGFAAADVRALYEEAVRDR